MKRVLSGFLIMTLCLCLAGCVPAQKVSADGEVNGMDAAVNNFFKLMDKDESNNKKSVFWDGTEAKMIDDDLDDDSIDDGRSYRGCEYLDKRYWSTNIYGMEGRNEVVNTDDHVLFTGASWRFEVVTIDNFDDAVNELKADKYLKMQSEEVDRTTFMGIKEFDGKYYAGYEIILDDLFGHKYDISYYGTGNMEDIGIMAGQVVRQFTVHTK